jgi:hypothetical protein
MFFFDLTLRLCFRRSVYPDISQAILVGMQGNILAKDNTSSIFLFVDRAEQMFVFELVPCTVDYKEESKEDSLK